MSKLIASSAIRGAHKIVKDAEEMVRKAIAEKGADCPVGFPDTAYSLPVIYSLLGLRVETLADMEPVLEECRGLLPPIPEEQVWLPYLGGTLDAGMATLFAFELIEACKYLAGVSGFRFQVSGSGGAHPETSNLRPETILHPVHGIWLGAANDVIIRERGIEFVDGSAPGFAAVVGAAPDKETAVRIARELQEKNLYVFIAGHTNGVSFAEQLAEAGVELGWDTRLVPFGKEISAAIYALGFANRAALSFGGVKPGDYGANLRYNKNRIFAFVMALGEVDEEKYAAAAGAISYGFPTIADTDIPQILPTGICTYEHVVSSVPHERIVEKCLEVRGCKVKITKVPIPVAYGAAFEGERIRKEQTFVEFGGNRTHAFEYVTTRELSEVEDGKITVVGPEVDGIEPGTALPLAIWVEAAGRKMQPDFEPILERQIHHLTNGAEGVWHMGQRDIIWIRISKGAQQKGFTIGHLGEILHAKLLSDYPAIVDKVQVTLYTELSEVEPRLAEARRVYRERNLRLEAMTDDSVDTFYSCLLCQSFAPNHVCVITPERLGLCGAYNWLDGKAAYEIDPTGPNQPLVKGECLDPVRGQWQNINDYVYANSKQTIGRINAYSMLEHPMTSCLVADTEIIVDNKLVRMGDFIDAHRGREAYTNSSSLTLDGGRIVAEKLVALQRFPAPERLIRLRMKSGTEVTLTPEHEVAVDRPDGLQWVRADQVRERDRMVSIKRLALDPELPHMVDILPDACRVRDTELIREMKEKLRVKYGSVRAAYRHLGLGQPDQRVESLPLGALKAAATDLGEVWEAVRGRVSRVGHGPSSMSLPRELNADLFYVLGLLASDGSISKRGPGEYRIDFVNTEEALIHAFRAACGRVFPDRDVRSRQRKPAQTPPEIGGRGIHSARPCFQCYQNNPLIGVLCERYGIKVGASGKWDLGSLLSLPEDLIAAFLAGVFDGDGSVRLRSHDGQWRTGEAYLCHEDERAARHLQLLLKRLGIVGSVRRDRSVWRVELHGANLRRFAQCVEARHPAKRETLAAISALPMGDRLDKTQTEVLSLSAGRLIAAHAAGEGALSASTRYYYETGRSRPVAGNVRRALAAGNEDEALVALLDPDYFLDAVTSVETVDNSGQFEFVYNLTLADTHCYFVNGGPLVKNCGCFEAIVALLPECNGVMIVNREFSGMTPAGMKFSTLAGQIGGGVQTPGFIGIGKAYITSKKFISAEGGHQRVVWMPKELKATLSEELAHIGKRLGIENYADLIADETVGAEPAAILEFMRKVDHPALAMWDITEASPEAREADAARLVDGETGRRGDGETAVAHADGNGTKGTVPPAAVAVARLAPAAPPAWSAPPTPQTWGERAPAPPTPQTWGERAPAPPTPQTWGEKAPAPPTPQTWGEKADTPAPVPPGFGGAGALVPVPPGFGGSGGPISYVLSVLDQVRSTGLPQGQPADPAQQMAALQVSTALNLLMAGANMLLMYGGGLEQTPEAVRSSRLQPAEASYYEPQRLPAHTPELPEGKPEPVPELPALPAPGPEAPTAPETPEIPREPTPPTAPERPLTSAAIVVPSSFSVPPEKINATIRTVTLGGSGTRTSAVTLGGASALPFRHFEGDTGCRPVVAMEVFDQAPRNYPDSLKAAYGDLLADPAKMARYCVEELGAEVISVRLEGTHPDNGDRSPDNAARTVESVLKAVGVPLIVAGPAHFEKTNAVLKQVASAFANENLLLSWAETDNYKTIAAAAMGYNHCVVAQTPIDVNMAKQLNILITNMGLAPEKIVVDALTGALGYGLEYTYSVMERIRTAAFTGDAMLAMPMLGTPGYEVAKTKESKAPASAFPLWGPESERGALLEIATAMSLLNAGADLLILYHPVAARTVKRKIAEMTNK